MYYFGYCTWLNPPELHRYFPEAKVVAKGYVANHKLEFHAAAGRADRGWCHLSNTGRAWGNNALGIVVEHPDHHFEEDYDDFERCFVSVRGDDGKVYDCWTYRMSAPGSAMRPPNFYWNHIPEGMKHWGFPDEYVRSVLAMYEEAADCPRADRPNPSTVPGRSADTR
ncbi:gamma-glutamylcyclotransferase [Azospirillum melinis]|uniref:Gamma-glutamylcyclotransferase n=1 Tax=Azospirillum melinis TaxID=328839 RepID=A0ABX2KF21_9PROT|nr:gamma-glutamylcyclotransferase [Azospirillum melinis]